MKRIALILLFVLSGVSIGGCGQPVNNEDMSTIQAALKTYYAALNSYDIDSVEGLFSEETWIEDGWKYRSYIQWAQNNKAAIEFASIKAVDFHGDSAKITVEVQSDQVPGDERYSLARILDGWQFTELLTEKFDGLGGKLFYTPGLPSAKCACK